MHNKVKDIYMQSKNVPYSFIYTKTTNTVHMNKIISKMSDFTWPTCSPDLNRLNFCLLGNTKEEIHQA